MNYYLKVKKKLDGTFELYDKMYKSDRNKIDNYFVRVRSRDNYFLYIKRTGNGVSIYTLSNEGKLLRKRDFVNTTKPLVQVS
jgi:hypothetical protein